MQWRFIYIKNNLRIQQLINFQSIPNIIGNLSFYPFFYKSKQDHSFRLSCFQIIPSYLYLSTFTKYILLTVICYKIIFYVLPISLKNPNLLFLLSLFVNSNWFFSFFTVFILDNIFSWNKNKYAMELNIFLQAKFKQLNNNIPSAMFNRNIFSNI